MGCVGDPFGLLALALALVFFLVLLFLCLANPLIGSFFLSWLFLPIAWRSSSLFLVPFIGLSLGVSFPFSTLIVRLLTFPGRWPMGFSTLPSVCPLLVTISRYLAFVLPLVSLCNTCFLTVRLLSVFCHGYSRFFFVCL